MKSVLVFISTALVASCVSAQGPVCSNGESFASHEDCNKYYQCDNGVPVEQDCGEDLYWNPVAEICDFPENVLDCDGGTRAPVGPTTSVPISTTTVVVTTGLPPGVCPSTGTVKIPHEERCGSYYLCVNGQRMEESKCPGDLYFDPTVQECNLAELVDCVSVTGVPTVTTVVPTTVTGLPPGVCPSTGIVKIAHEERCGSYYLCVNGERMPESECAGGLYFDPSLQECNLAELVDCVSGTGGTTLAPITSTSSTLPQCPPTGTVQLPYPGNCALYIMCVEEFPIVYRCPDGELFDVIDALCKPEALAVCSKAKNNKY